MVQLSKNITDSFRRKSWNKIHLGSFPDNILKKLKWLQFEFAQDPCIYLFVRKSTGSSGKHSGFFLLERNCMYTTQVCSYYSSAGFCANTTLSVYRQIGSKSKCLEVPSLCKT